MTVRGSRPIIALRMLIAGVATIAVVTLAPTAAAVSTTLVINEVDYDQASTDTAEFLELLLHRGERLRDGPVDDTVRQRRG